MKYFPILLLVITLFAVYAAACHGAQSPRRKFENQGNSTNTTMARQAAYADLSRKIQVKQAELKADGMDEATGEELRIMMDLTEEQISDFREQAHILKDKNAESIFPKSD